MFCRNCGKELIGSPEICINCGAKPMSGTSFCPGCSAPTTPLTEICTKCGARVTKLGTWKPTTAGILGIIAGVVGIGVGILVAALGTVAGAFLSIFGIGGAIAGGGDCGCGCNCNCTPNGTRDSGYSGRYFCPEKEDMGAGSYRVNLLVVLSMVFGNPSYYIHYYGEERIQIKLPKNSASYVN